MLPSQTPTRRIYSSQPSETPFETPEPRNGESIGQASNSPAAQLAELMTTAMVQGALHDLSAVYAGPFCHPRLTHTNDEHVPSVSGPSAFIPDKAEPLHGSIQALRDTFNSSAPKFDLIVLDPPWPNRSARRRTNKYATASNLPEISALLSQIPVASHLAPDGLVAIWITNKASIIDTLTSPTGVLASWGLELVTEWTWLKVTTAGEPLYNIESQWRKPWEKIVIAKRKGVETHKSLKSKMLIAVPDVHSRKPNLRRLFQDIFGEEYKGLEVFARNLTAGWWCWGDEVLSFQQREHWRSIEDT